VTGDLSEKSLAPPDQLTLALERTYLAHERTMMAWTRTATSLITFGFTLYKFFEYLHEHGQKSRSEQLFSPRTFGLMMIGIGVVTLVVASVQHQIQMRRLRTHYSDAPISLAFLVSGLIAFLGLLGFISGLMYSPPPVDLIP
jgi:putative membrane protein